MEVLDQLERNHEFRDMSNSLMLKRITAILQEGEVCRLRLHVSYKTLNKNPKIIPKSKTDKKIGGLDIRYNKDDFIECNDDLTHSHLMEDKESQCSAVSKALNLYEEAKYPEAIALLKDREKELKSSKMDKQNKNSLTVRKELQAISFSLGNCYFRLKNIDKAIEYYQKKQTEEEQFQKGQRLNNLGTCYAMKKNYQQALKSYNEALKVYNQMPHQDLSNLMNNIGTIYRKSDMFKVAEEFFLKSIAERKAKSPNNKLMLYSSYFELGICQKQQKKYEESLNHLNIALNYTSEGIGKAVNVLKEICLLYEEQEKYGEALAHYEKLSEEYEAKGMSQGYIYERVSKIHDKIGNSVQAARFSNKAYRLYMLAGDERKLSELSGSLSLNAPFINQL